MVGRVRDQHSASGIVLLTLASGQFLMTLDSSVMNVSIATVAHDVGAFAVGSRLGRTPLAPSISPNKTWEGVMGASTATLIACLLIVRAIHPWNVGRAFALALVVSVVAPIGDLCESMLKRDLGVKDIGWVLPGHGGFLDRIDALLFVVPATYYLVRLVF